MFFCEEPKEYDNIYLLSSYVHLPVSFNFIKSCIIAYFFEYEGRVLTLLYKILSVRIAELKQCKNKVTKWTV